MLKLLKKHFKRNKKYFSCKNILHKMNGIVLLKTSDALFALNGVFIDEVVEYCKKQGYEVEKVVFISSYDADLKKVTKRIRTKSSSDIYIIEEEGKYVAVFVIGSYLEIE